MQVHKENSMSRGQSKAAKNAMEYLKLYPDTPAKVLAVKFEVDTSTIYRSDWWKENKERREKECHQVNSTR